MSTRPKKSQDDLELPGRLGTTLFGRPIPGFIGSIPLEYRDSRPIHIGISSQRISKIGSQCLDQTTLAKQLVVIESRLEASQLTANDQASAIRQCINDIIIGISSEDTKKFLWIT